MSLQQLCLLTTSYAGAAALSCSSPHAVITCIQGVVSAIMRALCLRAVQRSVQAAA